MHNMQRLQAFKYELMPTGEQQRQMRAASRGRAGSCSTRRWRCRRSATSAATRSLDRQDFARNSLGGATARKRPGFPLPRSTRCSRRSRTWSGPLPISSPGAPTSRGSGRKASPTASATPIRNNSRSTLAIGAYFCPGWAGFPTLTAGTFPAQRRTSPCRAAAGNGGNAVFGERMTVWC